MKNEKLYTGIVSGIIVGTAIVCMGQSIPATGGAVEVLTGLYQLAADVIAAVTS